MENDASSFQVVSQSVARQAASARVSVTVRDWTRSVNSHMGNPELRSLFFFAARAGGHNTLVIHGSFLRNECHVCGGGTVNGSAENAVVGIGGSGERFPCTTGKRVAALLARPNADRLALNLLVLTNRTVLFSGRLGLG